MTVEGKTLVPSCDHRGAEETDVRPSKLTDLIGQIRAEQRKFDRNEGPLVANLIRIGMLLIDLKPLAGRTWATMSRELGYHPRVASRFQKIGKSWLAEIGTSGSEILDRLPADAQKLEWLCRLSQEQLVQFLGHLDCKRADRRELVAAVREVLGEQAPPHKPPDLEKQIEREAGRLTALAERILTEEPEGAGRQRLQTIVALVLHEVEQTLAGRLVPASPPAAGQEEPPAPAKAQEPGKHSSAA